MLSNISCCIRISNVVGVVPNFMKIQSESINNIKKSNILIQCSSMTYPSGKYLPKNYGRKTLEWFLAITEISLLWETICIQWKFIVCKFSDKNRGSMHSICWSLQCDSHALCNVHMLWLLIQGCSEVHTERNTPCLLQVLFWNNIWHCMIKNLFLAISHDIHFQVFGPKYGDEPMFETLRFGNIPLTGMDITDHRTYNATFVELGYCTKRLVIMNEKFLSFTFSNDTFFLQYVLKKSTYV